MVISAVANEQQRAQGVTMQQILQLSTSQALAEAGLPQIFTLGLLNGVLSSQDRAVLTVAINTLRCQQASRDQMVQIAVLYRVQASELEGIQEEILQWVRSFAMGPESARTERFGIIRRSPTQTTLRQDKEGRHCPIFDLTRSA